MDEVAKAWEKKLIEVNLNTPVEVNLNTPVIAPRSEKTVWDRLKDD